MTSTNHQQKQRELIEQIAKQAKKQFLPFSTVSPVEDYAADSRICLTSVHVPHQRILEKVQRELIEPLRKIECAIYFYPSGGLHMTIKNIRVINNPPHFNQKNIETSIKIFSEIVPQHKRLNIYFFRLLLFPNNLALVGTTDEELDWMVLDLDQKLRTEGVPDDKIYANSHIFFSNMTLARFNQTPSETFKQKVEELSQSLRFEPYQVDSVTLATCNAVFQRKNILGTWKLK